MASVRRGNTNGGVHPFPLSTLSAELRKIVGDPALSERFAKIGFDPTPTTSEDMIQAMRKTRDDWTPVIRRLNIKLD